MKKSFLAVALTVLILSGTLFTKSFVSFKNNSLVNLITENLEALTNGDVNALYHQGQGTCGVKFYTIQWNIFCGISYNAAQSFYTHLGGYWCCDNCESSTYCAGNM